VEMVMKAMVMGLLTRRSPAAGFVTECIISNFLWICREGLGSEHRRE
jgi:hypothetical protein